jgi:hypothetical protein
MDFLRYLRDVFIAIGVLLIIAGICVGWAILAVCALAFTYLATVIMEYRPLWIRKKS